MNIHVHIGSETKWFGENVQYLYELKKECEPSKVERVFELIMIPVWQGLDSSYEPHNE